MMAQAALHKRDQGVKEGREVQRGKGTEEEKALCLCHFKPVLEDREYTMTNSTTCGFPFAVNELHFINATGGDEAIRGKIIQVLFTAPGERVNLPEFGCGLFNLVFEPNGTVLAAATEFTVGQSLARWLGNEISVDGVEVSSSEEIMTIEIAYTKRDDLSKQAVRIHFR